LARSLGAKLATNGTVTAAVAAQPMAVVANSHWRRSASWRPVSGFDAGKAGAVNGRVMESSS
jgi:hypothetical protein